MTPKKITSEDGRTIGLPMMLHVAMGCMMHHGMATGPINWVKQRHQLIPAGGWDDGQTLLIMRDEDLLIWSKMLATQGLSIHKPIPA